MLMGTGVALTTLEPYDIISAIGSELRDRPGKKWKKTCVFYADFTLSGIHHAGMPVCRSRWCAHYHTPDELENT